jgi:hypothetical protein
MQVSFHLVFGGQCEAAFQFYERTLGGKIVSTLTYGNSPMAEQVPPEWRGKIASVERSCPTQRRASQHASCQRIFRGDRNRDNFTTHPKRTAPDEAGPGAEWVTAEGLGARMLRGRERPMPSQSRRHRLTDPQAPARETASLKTRSASAQ